MRMVNFYNPIYGNHSAKIMIIFQSSKKVVQNVPVGGILSNDEERMSYLRRKSNKLRIKFVLFLNKLYLCLQYEPYN